jgi:ionotropic glutamate receptor
MAPMFQTSERLRSLEMVQPWFYTQMAFLIPIPGNIKNNVDALIKPFQFWVRY